MTTYSNTVCNFLDYHSVEAIKEAYAKGKESLLALARDLHIRYIEAYEKVIDTSSSELEIIENVAKLLQDERNKEIEMLATARILGDYADKNFLSIFDACRYKHNKYSRLALKSIYKDSPAASASDKDWQDFMLKTFEGLEQKLQERFDAYMQKQKDSQKAHYAKLLKSALGCFNKENMDSDQFVFLLKHFEIWQDVHPRTKKNLLNITSIFLQDDVMKTTFSKLSKGKSVGTTVLEREAVFRLHKAITETDLSEV